jgi:hypothetical protein
MSEEMREEERMERNERCYSALGALPADRAVRCLIHGVQSCHSEMVESGVGDVEGTQPRLTEHSVLCPPVSTVLDAPHYPCNTVQGRTEQCSTYSACW